MTDETSVRLTYAELAEARGVSLGAARRMVHRHKWPKQVGNDGLSRIVVPVSFVARSVDSDVTEDTSKDVDEDVSTDVSIDAAPVRVVPLDEAVVAFAQVTRDAISDVTKDVMRTLQEAITSLRVELYTERDRADRAEREVHELRA